MKFADGGVYAGFIGGGDDDGAAMLEAGFGDAVADSGTAAEDKHARVAELVCVFCLVGHCVGWMDGASLTTFRILEAVNELGLVLEGLWLR